MPTLLEESPKQATTPSARLRHTMAAVRLSFVWLGCRKTLSQEQKAQAADTFGAEGDYVSAAKKLLDTTHPAFKAVSSLKSRIVSYWKSMSLPYPEPGIRLIRQDDIGAFQVHMTSQQASLAEAVENLNQHYSELKSQARRQLGRLFNHELAQLIEEAAPMGDSGALEALSGISQEEREQTASSIGKQSRKAQLETSNKVPQLLIGE